MSWNDYLPEVVNLEPVPTYCLRCLVRMVPGEALQDVLSGSGDFHAGDDVVTLSPSGRARMVPCLKCPSCGQSVTK